MNIQNEQLEALRPQQPIDIQHNQQLSQANPFDTVLDRQIELAEQASQASAAAATVRQSGQASAAAMCSQMLLASSDDGTASAGNAVQRAFAQASGTLDMWDSYVDALQDANATGSLRHAYVLLQDINAQVASLKAGSATVRGQDAGLDALVNALDVMAVTERFKFNRGDYTL